MAKLEIDNVTHWKTSDIRRLIRAAMAEGGGDPKPQRRVDVIYQPKGQGSNISYIFKPVADGQTEMMRHIRIFLPKRGPKVPHHNAMVVLGAATIESKTPILAVSDTYFLGNALAWEFAKEEDFHGDKEQELRGMKRSTNPPDWQRNDNLIITKYADPKKDAGYLSFVKKKEKLVAGAQVRITKYRAEVAAAKKRLARANKDEKKALKALADAKKRRT